MQLRALAQGAQSTILHYMSMNRRIGIPTEQDTHNLDII